MVRSVTVVLILTAVAYVCANPVLIEGRDVSILTKRQVDSVGKLYSASGNFGADTFSSAHGGAAYGEGDGGHGGNIGGNNYGGSGDTGRITYAG